VVEGLVEGTVYYFVVTSEVVNLESSLSFEVTATAPLPILVSINLEPADTSTASGISIQYKATGKFSNGTTIDLTSSVDWKSTDTKFATINNTTNRGFATVDQIGTTTILATDPISKIVGETSLRTQLNHNTLGAQIPDCLTTGCHALTDDHPTNSTVMCFACHSTKNEPYSWFPLLIDHETLSVEETCVSCHDGTVITKQSINHIPTKDNCEACHRLSIGWAAPFNVNHFFVIGTCFSCHNITIAKGKPTTHILTSDKCDACHSTGLWVPTVKTDHTETIGTCISCHNGELVPGRTAAHIKTSTNCDACHFDTVWIPVLPTGVDHTQVIGDTCYSCHNLVVARGKPSLHIASSNICDDCHVVLNWTTIKAPL